MGCIGAGGCWSRMVIGTRLNRLIIVLIPANLLITCGLISLLSLLWLVVRGLHCMLGISHLGLTISRLGLCLVNRLLVNWLWGSIHRGRLLVLCLGLRSGVTLTVVGLLRLGITLLWLAIRACLGLAIGGSLGLGIHLLGLSLISGASCLVVALMHAQSVAMSEPTTVEWRAEASAEKAKSATITAPKRPISAITATIPALEGRAISETVAAVSTIS